MAESVALMVHPEKREAAETAERMRDMLSRAGIPAFYPQRRETAEKCGMVLTFGGDGTLLSGARTALKYGCPLMGIHMGTVGFLTEGEADRLEEVFQALRNRAYTLESRSLLAVRVEGDSERFLALNDAVVTRGVFARLIQVETRINGEHWGTFIADGVIAATPTGSTGYSLSAGGPVIAPGVDCVAVTPVCAHSFQHCPCIVPGNAEILFHLRSDRDHQAQLQIDGQSLRTLRAGDTVRITGAPERLQLARLEKYRFFSVLKAKLNEWSSPREDAER